MRSSKSRSRNKSNRQRSLGNIVNRVFDSSGPEGKVRGTPQQIIEKYLALARDAQLSNDRVAEQSFLQHAEHYTRMLGEAQREMAREQAERQQNQQNRVSDEDGEGDNRGENRAERQNGDRRDRNERSDRQNDRRDDRQSDRRDDRHNDRHNDRRDDRRERHREPAPEQPGADAQQPELPAFLTREETLPEPRPVDAGAVETPEETAAAEPAAKPRRPRAPRKPKAEVSE